jgi:hypothetical protein
MAFWVKTSLLPFLEPDDQVIEKSCPKQQYKGYSNSVWKSEDLLNPRSIKETVYRSHSTSPKGEDLIFARI